MIKSVGWECEELGNLTFTNDSRFDDKVTSSWVSLGKDCKMISEAVFAAASKGRFVLTIGGDHSIACGSISGILRAKRKIAVIWVDAHADANTPQTTPSGNYHGMPAAHVLGWFNKLPEFEWLEHIPKLEEVNLAYIGLRDIDEGERNLLQKSFVHVFTMTDVDRYGIGEVMRRAIEGTNPNLDIPFHLSLDIDGLDPMVAPGTGTKARGGLSFREARYICEALSETDVLASMDLVEINPDLDEQSMETVHGDSPIISSNASPTVRLGIELVAAALGKSLCSRTLSARSA
eukprot:GHVL01035640.1.p1 GENE.GHVL01035640.1~~GHVL01035640.1.p1  ORF type:complete len:290 (+),score=42.37 GHVL01035640.1:253-1122(+)